MFKAKNICFNSSSSIEPAILLDTNTVAWYDGSAAASITKDGSNYVSRWNDRLGSGRDLIQTTGANQPQHLAYGLLFNGTSHYMNAATFALIQPEFIYMVLKQMSWTSGDCIFDGNSMYSGTLQQDSATPSIGLRANAGTITAANANLSIGSISILRILINGASSKIIINNTAATTGNTGAGDMNGFYLGCRSGGGFNANLHVKEIIIRKITDTAPNETLIYNYLKTKYSII